MRGNTASRRGRYRIPYPLTKLTKGAKTGGGCAPFSWGGAAGSRCPRMTPPWRTKGKLTVIGGRQAVPSFCYWEGHPDLNCGGLIPEVGRAVSGVSLGFPFLKEPILDVLYPHSHLACKRIDCGEGWVSLVACLVVGVPELSRLCDCHEQECEGGIDRLLHLKLGCGGPGDGQYGLHGCGATDHGTA